MTLMELFVRFFAPGLWFDLPRPTSENKEMKISWARFSRGCRDRWARIKQRYRQASDALLRWFLGLKWIIWLDKKFPVWEIWIVMAAFMAMSAMVANIIFLIVATSLHRWQPNGLGLLLEDNCKKVDWANKLAHGFINAMSTVSLKVPGFFMLK